MAQSARDYAGMDERALTSHARAGDREAFRTIMQRCNQRLFRIARAIVRSDDEAEDVLQETYLKAFAGLKEFRDESSLLTWLTAIALNEARGRLRKRRPLVELNVMDEAQSTIVYFHGAGPDPGPEAEAGRAEARRLLEVAIDALPDDFRIVFILREIEGCDIQQTATQLGINPQTVKTRLHRARRLLRRDLEQKISAGVGEVFPFLGLRCARIAERVLAKLPQDESC